MKISFHPKTILSFLCMVALLAACAPAAVSTPAVTAMVKPATVAPVTALPTAVAPIMSASATASGGDTKTFSDPFAYCAAIGTIDLPDIRYTGPKTPEAVVKGLMKASGAPADAPVDVFSQGTFWRCMDKQVAACFVGANLPCGSKANTSQEPTAEMKDFCNATPNSDFIPAAVTGHETIYAWACKDGQAITSQQVFHVDAQGYISEIWYAIAP